MARSLAEFEEHLSRPVTTDSQNRLDRSTARVLGAAVAALATATIVVNQSTNAFSQSGTATANQFESGTIELVDDDQGRSLVELENMAPGRPVEQCITITYAGTILPVDLAMSASTTGDVADYVLVDVERGVSGGFDSCDGFVPHASVYQGVLADIGSDDDPLSIGTLRVEGEAMAFRFTFDLADESDAAGRAGSVDFVWEAVPS